MARNKPIATGPRFTAVDPDRGTFLAKASPGVGADGTATPATFRPSGITCSRQGLSRPEIACRTGHMSYVPEIGAARIGACRWNNDGPARAGRFARK
jgi:hypothetical protein